MYDIIGDVHGCYEELEELLSLLGYQWTVDNIEHKEGRKPVFLGDLTDRGPNSVSVIITVASWVKNGDALYCPGNHCDKLYRYLLGRNVIVSNGLETTIEEFQNLSDKMYRRVDSLFRKLYENAPLYLQLDENKLIVAHAGIRPTDIGKKNKSVKTFVLYGDITGEKHPDGRPIRRDWPSKYDYDSTIVYGHTPMKEPRIVGNTINVDTGCVFGNKLTAYRYPEKEFVSVPSSQPLLAEKFRGLDPYD